MSGRPYNKRLRADGTPQQVYRCVIRDVGSDQCGRLGIDLRKIEAEVRAMVIGPLAKRLGEGRLSLTAYEPLSKRITKLTGEVDALREAGGERAARETTLEEITAEWDGGDVDTRRALIRRMAPRGLALLVPPDGRAAHTIPVKDRIAVI